jgi:hypothetical protein
MISFFDVTSKSVLSESRYILHTRTSNKLLFLVFGLQYRSMLKIFFNHRYPALIVVCTVFLYICRESAAAFSERRVSVTFKEGRTFTLMDKHRPCTAPVHGLINYIDAKVKCRHRKKLTCISQFSHVGFFGEAL